MLQQPPSSTSGPTQEGLRAEDSQTAESLSVSTKKKIGRITWKCALLFLKLNAMSFFARRCRKFGLV